MANALSIEQKTKLKFQKRLQLGLVAFKALFIKGEDTHWSGDCKAEIMKTKF